MGCAVARRGTRSVGWTRCRELQPVAGGTQVPRGRDLPCVQKCVETGAMLIHVGLRTAGAIRAGACLGSDSSPWPTLRIVCATIAWGHQPCARWRHRASRGRPRILSAVNGRPHSNGGDYRAVLQGDCLDVLTRSAPRSRTRYGRCCKAPLPL